MTADGAERKLAAIMFTDMVGYSALTTTNPPDHTKLRRLINRGLTPKRVADFENLVGYRALRHARPE